MLSDEIRAAAQTVLTEPRRIVFFLRRSPENALHLRRFFVTVLPLARSALNDLRVLADSIPHETLRLQAAQTLEAKAYHVAGACVLATFLPSMAREHYVKIVAPLEVVYDYLDTLCDRNAVSQEASLQVHEALADALDPGRPTRDYFSKLSGYDDGGFLASLVGRVRFAFSRLTDNELLRDLFAQAARLYAETQTLKHLPPEQRARACMAWHADATGAEDLTWWEYVAAAGSQFHVYGALYAAFSGRFDLAAETYEAYFPDMAAMHVLLDSFIDRDEDAAHDELSLVACYPDRYALLSRMRTFAVRAQQRFQRLPLPQAHEFAMRLMALFYLSHPKVRQQRLERDAAAILHAIDV